MKLQTSLITFAAVVLSSVVASSASAQAPFKINDVTINGDGCKKGTFTTRARGGGDQEVTIRFRDFEVTGGAPITTGGQRRANATIDTCEIRAAVTIPAGFQLVFVDSTVSGRVDVQGRRDTDLGLNNVARVTRRYQVVGGDSAIKETNLVNSDGNYSISDDFAFLTSACRGGDNTVLAGVTLNLAVTGRNNYANVRLFEEEGDAIRFGFRTRRCDDPPTIIPIGDSETVSNACVLKGTRRICYDRSGNQISNVAD